MASQVYYQGEFYDCVVPAGPGETPATHPENWSRVEIPRDAASFVVQKSYALLLSGEGQEDKRRGAERDAARNLDAAILAMARNRTQPDTMRVMIR